MLTEFRERGRGERSRERNIDRLPLVHIPTRDLLFVPQWGPNPFTSYVPWLGIEPAAFWITRNTPTEWATLARASNFFFNPCVFILFYFLSSPEDMPIDFRERGREEEKHRCEKETSVASPTCLTGDWTHNPGIHLATWPETEPATFWSRRQHSNQQVCLNSNIWTNGGMVTT